MGMIYTITHCGIAPEDSQDVIIEKQIITLLPLIIGVAAIFWGSIYFYYGHYLSASIPWSYSVISALSIAHFAYSKDMAFFKTSQLLLVMFLPFFLMWSLGGFTAGSYVMIWAFYAPLAAMAYSQKQSFLCLRVFVLLTVVSSAIDPMLIEHIEPMPPLAINIFSFLNISFGFVGIYFIINYFIKEKNSLTQSLQQLNNDLETRINEEVGKNRDKDQMMFEQARLASMGEMINNIAHQWRQPLNALSLSLQNLMYTYENGRLNHAYMERVNQKTDRLITHMSDTIDDFRNFFKPDRSKEDFQISECIHTSLDLLQATLDSHHIAIKYDFYPDFIISGYYNEFSQALLNLINNAKDALVESNSHAPVIHIRSYQTEAMNCLEISDNAGGIDEKIINMIFDPYFTTKDEGKGTGVGLFMSKMIIEKSLNGEISVKNDSQGAVFTLTFPRQ